jgi:threonylcarbamoyladenosine tRNA methylthiotransferase CDKAL1
VNEVTGLTGITKNNDITATSKKIWVEAYGCSANIADSEIVKGILLKNGFTMVDEKDEADLEVLVTCAVKDTTEHKMLSRIAKSSKGSKPLVVAGCLAKTSRELIELYSPRASLLGPHSLDKTLEIVQGTLNGSKLVALENSISDKVNMPRYRVNEVVGIVEIASGCLSDCSFCQTKIAKGKLRSYRIGEILRQIRTDLKEGCKEIWLTSTDTGCYGFDIGSDITELIEECCKIEGDFMLRIGMMNPMYLSRYFDKLISLYKNNAKIYKFIHIPVQSGSDAVLRQMKRGHNSMLFKNFISKIRSMIPEMTIATDIICGFPTESEEDFLDTVNLLHETKPDIVNLSKYASRPGTLASKMNKLDTGIVKLRSSMLHEYVRKISYFRNNLWLGWQGKILIDEVIDDRLIQGRNYAYKPVVLNGISKFSKNEMLGKALRIKVTYASKYSLHGQFDES